MRRVALALMLAAAPLSAQEARPPASMAEVALSFAPVVKAAAPAVVNVYTRKVVAQRSPFGGNPFFDQFLREFGGMPRRRVENSLGSGVVMRADGVVVTNAHVIADAVEIRVALSDRSEYDADILLFDPPSDLAVLKLRGAEGLPTLAARPENAPLEVGDLALAIGNPFGVGQTVTMGVISGLGRTAGRRGGGYFIQTDASINPGNSGGALVDMAGRLIGVNTAILSRSGGSVGIGFAIPASLVSHAVESALRGEKELVRPWAGVRGQPVTADLADALGLPRPAGVLIAALHPRSPFGRAGLRQGDVIVALDGAPVESPEELAFRLAAMGVGGTVTLEAVRRGETVEAEVALIAPPPGAGN
ncbi:trypsin-like peptidase domain-containing protein [Rubrimonas cliftonensis]|uniref:Serine protease, S1-C subfamily, contains C-terminal PDZ domain n=1 Tax=Rubrimonas cliftonensis TaxID=89524 RepID=A0A1H4A3Q4_9RHOB|nr:trypsin-like peptidase domain-containing protein [Rubrimonas cliftonensis]SEA30645.1 serine protease, S1-C subfamily, contains C-terminal PDZ domain [Rubrimonas cliftonensis]